jgi:hypothetical protein
MGDKAKVADPNRDVTASTLLLGIAANAPVLQTLNLITGQAVVGDASQLNQATLGTMQINRVICALFSDARYPHHDAVSVIEALVNIGFGGELMVLAPPLLRPRMVETELRDMASMMTLRLFNAALPPLSEV